MTEAAAEPIEHCTPSLAPRARFFLPNNCDGNGDVVTQPVGSLAVPSRKAALGWKSTAAAHYRWVVELTVFDSHTEDTCP